MTSPTVAGPDRGSRVLLALCAAAVGFAAIDTYVVVLALPDMMASAQIEVTELQRAAPIVSGFLLGYVAMLPLIGRIADLRGQVPVLVASLVVFAVGSLLTAVSYDLATMVAGRFLQGVGGGGLVPATMALVAALYPVERRGMPLGLVSAVQEFGAVLGPLFGALVLTFTSWHGIFAINLAVGLLLAAAVRTLGRHRGDRPTAVDPPDGRRSRPLPDLLSIAALATTVVAGLVLFVEPIALRRSLRWGELFVPYVETDSRWITPIGAITVGAGLVLLARSLLAARPLINLRSALRAMVEADLRGAVLLAVALGGVVLAFATADPEVAVLHEQATWFLLVSAAAAVVFGIHVWRTPAPIVQPRDLSAVAAWGSLVVSFLIGWALIAALVDIPLFARTTTQRESQLGAALILLRFLAALPIGAVIGGWLLRRLPAGPIAAVGLLAGAVGFWWMAQWDETALESAVSNVPLVVAGLGFGVALAPVNAAMLATTRHHVHGLASALVVVARMVGMLVGISVLTTWGLNRFYEAQRADPSLSPVELAIVQEQTVFYGAAATAALAALAALVLFRGAPTRGVRTADALRM
ncbi:MFS transporter [Nocardioides panacisoli]|uniref:MFS transporter n=1 Tax=Nocardioides panacisoli TaxID=627624 RepID=UPI001C6367D8|nr:MFS transporter [Nocardioides panacisoli]QYJ05367.1 MFS transporter [Nocardioides panacisoli]